MDRSFIWRNIRKRDAQIAVERARGVLRVKGYQEGGKWWMRRRREGVGCRV